MSERYLFGVRNDELNAFERMFARSGQPPSEPPRPSCLTRRSEHADEAPYQVRVERDEGWCDLVEIVDEPLSSRSSKAVPTGLNGRVTLTTDEARWVRDALCQILGPEGT